MYISLITILPEIQQKICYNYKHGVDIFKQVYQNTAPVCYSDLPPYIKMSQSLDTFKCNIRNHIMSIN